MLEETFFQLSIEKHPDKNLGLDKGFDQLKEAYDAVCRYINENVNDDNKDEEESIVRKDLSEANIVIFNSDSVTVKPLTTFIPFYEDVLEEEYRNNCTREEMSYICGKDTFRHIQESS